MKKNILALSFFPAFSPPRSGGELRLLNFYRGISEEFDISLVSWTHPNTRFEIIQHGPAFKEYRVPKEPSFDLIYQAFHASGGSGEFSAAACALAGRGKTRYHEVVAELSRKADAVIHDSPFTLLYDPGIWDDGKPRIYNSYNVESEMMPSLIQGGRVEDVVAFIYQLESTLVSRSRLVFATSPDELIKFRILYNVPATKLRLAPNGFSPEHFAEDRSPAPSIKKKFALFFGSQHPPNIEAAQFIADVIAPKFPTVRFVIAGAVCKYVTSSAANLDLRGEVDDETKKDLFHQATLFINPMLSGAGTSLKMVEAMAAGLPIVTSRVGARGLGMVDNVHALFAEPDDFEQAIRRVLQSPSVRNELSKASQEMAARHFSWPSITRTVAMEIGSALAGHDTPPSEEPKPLTLVVNDYPLGDAAGGGAKRILSLSRRLAEKHDVVLLCFHGRPTVEVEEVTEGLFEVRVPKTLPHRRFETALNNRSWISTNDITAALFCLDNPTMLRLFRRFADRASALVFVHPYMAPLLESTGASKPVIYDSQNVESVLKRTLLQPHCDGAPLADLVLELERYICRHSVLITTTTEADQAYFKQNFSDRPSITVMNGADVLSENEAARLLEERSLRDLSEGFRAVFIGSSHPPNVDAVKMLCAKVLPELPNMELWIIGSAGENLHEFAHFPNLRCFGVVTETEKRKLLSQADIALNPVMGGGGSNLKTADYFGHALPTISTETGARGFDIRDGHELQIRATAEFVDAIRQLIDDHPLRQRLAAAGYAFARDKLGWNTLGDLYARRIAETFKKINQRSPKILVVTYRYTEPALGGAEEYLIKLLSSYSRLYGATIDLIAPNVEQIRNVDHFASVYQPGTAYSECLVAPFLRSIQLFPPDPLDLPKLRSQAQELFALWIEEDRMLARQAIPRLAETSLMGGWYHSESVDGVPQRWSSECAEIYVPRDVSGIKILGWRAGGFDIEIRINGGAASHFAAQDQFCLEFKLAQDRDHLISLRLPPYDLSGDDTRKLGFILKRMEILRGESGFWEQVSVNTTYDTLLRKTDLIGWIETLCDAMRKRPQKTDDLFRAVRVPRSAALIAHLKDVASRYDAVLVHGSSFSLPLDAMAVLQKQRTPVIALPHFHTDDRFYYWREFIEGFAKADRVLSVSHWVSENVFAKLGITSSIINGGGIDPSEYLSRGDSQRDFQTFRGSNRPYFLVLGRKTGAKGYRTTIEAHRQILRIPESQVDLVIIGPDEDGAPISEPGVYYYGRLSRNLVLGALAGCIAIVSMSESESFGIVLVEAWMAGKPVIANLRCLSFSELVDDGEDGLLVETVDEVVGAMKFLLANPEKASAMGAAGHDKAFSRYSWDASAHRLHEIIMESAFKHE